MCDDRTLVLCDLAHPTGWQGVTPDAEVTCNGAPSVKWDHAKAGTVSASDIPHDWSSFDCLQFALHSNKATDADVELVLASENSKLEGAEYLSTRIRVDWTGWREFTIRFSDMSIVRQPMGFSKIDGILFAAEGWGHHPNPESVIHIADLRLGHVDSPGISDADFFSLLNLDYPGLQKVKSAVGAGDLASAEHEFAEYLRHREKPVYTWDWHSRPRHDSRPTGVDTERADRVLNGEGWSVNVWHKFDGPIDWSLNPIGYNEWPFQFNRHHGWTWLGQAYWGTGEEKYAREFVRQLEDWIRRTPPPVNSAGNSTYTWRTIEQGIRMGQVWPDAYYRFLTSPSFTDEAMILFVKSCMEHARILNKNATTGNWLTMETNGLMHVGVMFPELKESAEWRKTATDRMYAELDKQVYPDGAQIELSTGYHQVSLLNFIMAWEIAHLNNVPMPADYVAKIQRMYDYNLYASMPGGDLPGLNDSGQTNIKGSLKQAFSFFPERKDFLWVATQGAEGQKPKVNSIALPFSGHLIMRTGWNPDDLYMLFDAGPFGYGHQHEDALNFVICAYGKYGLIDPGNYPYDSSEWRKYVLSTRAHNTVMIDGQDQHRRGRPRTEYVISKPLPSKWIAGDGFDYASGTYDDGYGADSQIKVTHTRSIFFVKPEYWIVTDFLSPADDKPHKYESLFHLDADEVLIDGTTVRTANKDAANLCIFSPSDTGLSVNVVKGQEKPVVQGWIRSGGYDVRPIPTPVFEKEQAGPTNMQYVFFPTAKGTQCPVTSVKRIDAGTAAGIEITFADGHTDYFVQSQDHAKIKFRGFETDASTVLVRVRDGKVVKAMLAGGTKLTQSGKPVPAEVRAVTDLSKTELTHKF